MQKKFNAKHGVQIKNTVKSMDMYLTKKAKIEAQIVKLEEELKDCEEAIQLWEAPIISLTGYHIDELVEKVKVKTGVKDGKDIYKWEYKLRFPETIIPEVQQEEFDDSSLNEDKPDFIDNPINNVLG